MGQKWSFTFKLKCKYIYKCMLIYVLVLFLKKIYLYRFSIHCEPKAGEQTWVLKKLRVNKLCSYYSELTVGSSVLVSRFLQNYSHFFFCSLALQQYVSQRREEEDHKAVTLSPGWRYISCREDDEVLAYRYT